MVDEVDFAEIVFVGVEKSVGAYLKKLMTLFGRKLQGVTGGDLHATPDCNRLAL